jgi:gliding motility-associated-like protein
MKNWIFLSVAFLFLKSSLASAFTFTVTPTPETCSGNGVISFSVSNAAANGTIVFVVYKLPNNTTPIAVVSSTSLTGLNFGNYLIEARQTVGNVITTQQQQVTILNQVEPLRILIDVLNQACTSTSSITVRVKTGTAVSYEIFDGPVLFPPQTSNVFENLPLGTYSIRVFDNCGNALVRSVDVTFNTTGYELSSPVFTSTIPASCDWVNITQTITPAEGTVISYPLTLQYTIIPPSGPNITLTSTLTTGDSLSHSVTQTIPAYPNQNYTFQVTASDTCGTSSIDSFQATQNIEMFGNKELSSCGNYFMRLAVINFTPPYSLTFNTFPSGFSPTATNSSYPGPYQNANSDFGDIDNPIPFGIYNITIDDACGRTATQDIEFLNLDPLPLVTIQSNSCIEGTGKATIVIPNYEIATAIITNAPNTFFQTLPYDVSSAITNGILQIDDLPFGNYTIQLTELCNNPIAPVEFLVTQSGNQGLTRFIRKDCNLGFGSIKITSKNGALTSVRITAAPTGFPFTLPYDVSNNIASDGKFYMNTLTDGVYSFSCIDECNFTNSLNNVNIEGLSITNDTALFQLNCGSFNVDLDFDSNATSLSLWLQVLLDPATNTWGNPLNENTYVEGSNATTNNAIRLFNNTVNINFAFNGTFRILAQYKSFYNGSQINNGSVNSGEKLCHLVLDSGLTFNNVLEIVDYFRTPCSSSGNIDVIVLANGTGPLNYRIVDNLGNTIIDNGTSNIFSNLAPGIYNFQVSDACNAIVQRIIDITATVSLLNVFQPNNISICLNTITSNETFDLTLQTPLIIGSQDPNNYTVTYFTSLADAQNNVNPITNPTNFNPNSNQQTVYARVIFNSLPDCYLTTNFDVIVNQIPVLNLESSYSSCLVEPFVLDASIGNLPSTQYQWSNNEVTPVITIDQIGTYNFTIQATNTFADSVCLAQKAITVFISQLPIIDKIETVDWAGNQNSIRVYITNQGQFEFSLNGVNYQDESFFNNLTSGIYTLYVRDKNGCGTITQEVIIIDYPQYFTPNGDGFNDFWTIKNAFFSNNTKVYLYDRFGKLVKILTSADDSWDGKVNGQDQISTDYWFVVMRQNQEIKKGHFSLKR